MVATRRMMAMAGRRPIPADSNIGRRMHRARRWTKRYRPTDIYKRHRIYDDQPKTQRVAAYSRRT